MQPGLIFVYNISTENVGTTLEESAYRLVQRKIYKVVKVERKETSSVIQKTIKTSLIHTNN